MAAEYDAGGDRVRKSIRARDRTLNRDRFGFNAAGIRAPEDHEHDYDHVHEKIRWAALRKGWWRLPVMLRTLPFFRRPRSLDLLNLRKWLVAPGSHRAVGFWRPDRPLDRLRRIENLGAGGGFEPPTFWL